MSKPGREGRKIRGANNSERLPRSFWFDPRFTIGIVLVAGSVLGVLALVAAADSGVLAYAARTALSEGERVHASDFDARSVRLDSVREKYLIQGEIPRNGFVVTRAVSAGELVPISAVGDVAGETSASVVVSVGSELAQSVSSGSVVDLWSAHKTEERVFGAPSVLVESATVVRVIVKAGMVTDRSQHSVELLVPRSKTGDVLKAIANSDALSLIPSTIPVKG